MSYSREELLKYHAEKYNLEASLQLIENEIAYKRKQRNTLRDILYYVNRITEIYEGVPLHIWKHSDVSDNFLVSTIESDNDRYAEVYPNAQVTGKYGMRIKLNNNGYRDKYCGSDYTDLTELTHIAKQYVAHGILPKQLEHLLS